ncbi:MAG: NAD-dependent epimerase/dehydratase family protein [Myxococcales bacterium]|jgi:UDP-glucuronate 4-epimerase|nr:NAD-dependent epimerase/dehydratase family protein [Myxococcales bacterium]
MHILVTGGAGFIGAHLCEALLADGHQVTCLDNFNAFYDPAIKRANVAPLQSAPGFSLVEGDILDAPLLSRLFQAGPDVVVHLAAWAGVRPSIENPAIYEEVNIRGTLNILEACRVHGVSKLVFASSSSVYGGRTDVPFRETDPVMRPISPYAATKVAGETLCYTYHHLYGLHVHALRFFTVYGPRQRPEMAIHLFADAMLRDAPISLFGDGESSRDYTYISDIVAGIRASIERCAGFEILNLGGETPTSLNRLVSLIAARLGRTPIVEHKPDQPGDVAITAADLSRAAAVLGYAPQVDIEAGIAKTCDWLLAQHGANPHANK